jgi:hypothetical protein
MRLKRVSKLMVLMYMMSRVTVSVAQTYPSAISTVLLNSRTLFLDEYTDPLQPKIRTTIFFTDFTEVNWSFSLRLKINGPNGIVIQTKPGIKPAYPLTIAPGQPYELKGADLSYYFNYNNLTFSGISKSQLETNNRLPEGFYTFCFEALDFETGKALSLPGCASAYLALNDPAIIFKPVCGTVIENIAAQNILFQWQLGNAHGALNPNQLAYKINLYEVNNTWTNPSTALLNSQALPIWESPALNQNTYLYSISDPPLEKGKRYVFTVRTIQENGRISFKNNGLSQPCYFHYGYYENDSISIISPVNDFQFTLSGPSQFVWKKPQRALANQMVSYTLKVVEIKSGQSPEQAILSNLPFYQQTYLATNIAIIDKTIPVAIWANIKRMGKYAWQVTAQSGSQQIAKSKVQSFTGPPEIEAFIAGGFSMKITKLDHFDKTNNRISGKCKTLLNNAWGGQETEFSFKDISITPIGNNEWVMLSGLIQDKITSPVYTLQPQSISENKFAYFKPDSIYVTSSHLKLSGKTEWYFPHAGTAMQIEKIVSKRCLLTLANNSFFLNNSYPVTLSKEYTIPVIEPFGFVFKLNSASEIRIYQSRYEWNFSGFVQMPSNVKNQLDRPTLIAFQDVEQLFYITQNKNLNSGEIRIAANTNLGFKPTTYILDFSESKSPDKFAKDSLWKGLYIQGAQLDIPRLAESTQQINLPLARSFSFTNTLLDSNHAFVNNKGFYLNASFPFGWADSLKFNTFVSKQASFDCRINQSEITKSQIKGAILIPVIDTLNTFPYQIELTDNGFNEGYLNNGLAGHTFTFNVLGAAEQKIRIHIKRAVFRGRNRLETDIDLTWPYFNLNLNGVQGLCIWGNGNIGFNNVNGKAALSYQANAKASGYDVIVDQLGCGRSGNVYAFGLSAKIHLDEEISGEAGPPVINAYSMYKNPLLSGSMMIPIPSNAQTGTTAITNSVHQSAGGNYTASLNSGFSESIAQLGFQNSDTITKSPFNTQSVQPLISNNIITEIKLIIDIIYRLKPFVKSDAITDKEWQVLDRLRKTIDDGIVQQTQITNARGLLNYVLNKVVEGIVHKINQPIQVVSNKAIGKVRTGINTLIVTPINTKIDHALSTVFEKAQQKIILQVEEQHHATVTSILAVVRNNLTIELKNSVSQSFEKQVTSKLINFVELGVSSKITALIRTEVGKAGNTLINEGAQANINLNNIMMNAATVFENISDTVKDVIFKVNAKSFISTAESLSEDAIAGIDWNAIADRILRELLLKGISSALANQISQTAAQVIGPYASALLASVNFDFNNLGQKLQNGQLDKIVKFDPTNIYIESPTADIKGTLKFTKNDVVYGDCWQANVFVRIKVPKKDNPIECDAFFLNGKTQNAQGFTYWFVKLGVQGLNIPLSPAPVVWDGADGYLFCKMKKTGPSTVVPDNSNKFGLGCRFYFYDQATSGKNYLFNLGADAEFNNAGFAIQLAGDASFFNYQKQNGKYKAPGFITGSGTMGYYKTVETSRIAGNFNTTLHTQPILCAGGEAGLDLRGSSNWKVWIGTQQNPLGAKVLCKDFLSNSAFLTLSNTGCVAGLGMNVNISAKSPWIELTALKFRGAASLQFGYNTLVNVQWEPDFKLNEASVSAWASAAIGIEYQTAANSNTLTLAGVNLSGALTYKSSPEAELRGTMSGGITILNYNLSFDLPVNYSLSKQQIIN